MSLHFSIHHLPSFSSSSSKHFTFPSYSSSFSLLHHFCKSSLGAVSSEANKDKQEKRCRAISKSRITEYPGDSRISKLHDIDVEGNINGVEIQKRVEAIKLKMELMEDGEINISAYDTAWVALVEDVDGNGKPQFPSCLEWIAKNQLPDGSWGDSELFLAHDRLLNTLACVVALTSWNMHPEKCERGMTFFRENISKLENENLSSLVGFEVAFPSLLYTARGLNIEVHDDSPILKDIFAKRNEKLKRIPREMMHKVPTSLLFSLEGMPGLDWKQLLKLQSIDGSFCFSPSSTAFALMKTKDENCLKYLNNVVNKFNGGVPNVYPVDMFEHIFMVDRLERLGISRYFQQEIKDCMNYVHRFWTEKGICWARNSNVEDVDDTAMAFRLLRLHGHHVSADVFKHFEKNNGEFLCMAGQSTQAVTGMFNLYRATQIVFPGEKILEHAKQFSSKFLKEKRAANELIDKWIITKNLPGEVAYALDVPWYANLPRVEARFYVDQYGGESDVWIGKTLYRMGNVNNNKYLELAKLDYNNCQALHQTEWGEIQQWYSESRLGEFGLSRRNLLLTYFVAAASIFEIERSHERLAWAKTAALLETVTSHVADDAQMRRKDFVEKFNDCIHKRRPDYSIGGRLNRSKITGHDGVAETVVATIDQIFWDILVSHGQEIGHDLNHTWKKWVSSWESGGGDDKCEAGQGVAEVLVQTINLSAGHRISEEEMSSPEYQRLLQLTNTLCHTLRRSYQNDKELKNDSITTLLEVEPEMQELVQLVFQNSSTGIDFNIKNTFFTVVKGFYYTAFCDSRTINFHIAKVLFDQVL